MATSNFRLMISIEAGNEKTNIGLNFQLPKWTFEQLAQMDCIAAAEASRANHYVVLNFVEAGGWLQYRQEIIDLLVNAISNALRHDGYEVLVREQVAINRARLYGRQPEWKPSGAVIIQ